jgi:predicted nucleotidyltransferase
VTDGLQEILGQKLRKVILYGSYARGDFDDESDIDIVALADVPRENTWKYDDKICDISSKLGLEYNVLISIFLNNQSFFESHLPVLPFYRNIATEGIEIYVSDK